METIGIGIVGSGYMGKAHASAMNAVGAVFSPRLRPRCEMLCATTASGAAASARAFGFSRSTGDWRELVDDHRVEGVIIASPQATHRAIALAAIERGKPVLCEKPVGESLEDTRLMTEAAERAGVVAMAAFNYVRAPASQLARQMVDSGEIGDIVHFRGEHTEDFLADPAKPVAWRAHGRANGTMGDLAPHIVNAALTLAGPIHELVADIETARRIRSGGEGRPARVDNDDQGQLLCRFESGAMGMLHASRVAIGRKMGYAFDIFGTRGAIRFDQEDQNTVWLYRGGAAPGREGFTRLLTGPDHPDYAAFCRSPGHGTGYLDQIVIEARDFLEAIADGRPRRPAFRDALRVSEVIAAAWASHEERRWVSVDEVRSGSPARGQRGAP